MNNYYYRRFNKKRGVTPMTSPAWSQQQSIASLKKQFQNQELEISLQAWVRTVRDQKNLCFVQLNDGSCLSGIQAVLDEETKDFRKICEQLTTGSAVCLRGSIVPSPAQGQTCEIKVMELEIVGTCPVEEYPLQKKRHSFEFLRTIAHLRPRTNTIGAVTRLRHVLSQATHRFFDDLGFFQVHTPVITASDCEGAGQMFRVTTLSSKDLDKNEEDFFGKAAYLTVSGQLNAEMYAMSHKNVYTFGPTFRAENSNTSRHLAEFWMLEPEMAFCDLAGNIELANTYLRAMVQAALTRCSEDLELFDRFVEKGLIDRLQSFLNSQLTHISYTEAIDILQKSGKSFEFPVKWGSDLQSEHERFLCEEHFNNPVAVTDYPAEIKAFYMRQNDDGKTVAAMDVLVPKVGEIIGGSQREEREAVLRDRIIHSGLKVEDYEWYLQLRRFGGVVHSGFGLGFERLVQWISGMENIRDLIPLPRYPKHAEF